LYWIFDFLEQEHPEVLNDMRERLKGDEGDQWVPKALAERFDAYQEIRPAGYKFVGEFPRAEQPPEYRDIVIAVSSRKQAENEANTYLSGAAKITVIKLSRDDLSKLGLQTGQIRK
jgi:hypothetical protein